MTPPDIAARIASAKEQLKTFIRIHNPGGCRMFSRGYECNCPLCLVDDLVADWERLRQRVAELEGALRPFADYAEKVCLPGQLDDAEIVKVTMNWPSPTIGDCRRAAAVFKANGNDCNE